jgi:hypothetical protein
MTPRVSPWEERYTLTDGADLGSGDHRLGRLGRIAGLEYSFLRMRTPRGRRPWLRPGVQLANCDGDG